MVLARHPVIWHGSALQTSHVINPPRLLGIGTNHDSTLNTHPHRNPYPRSSIIISRPQTKQATWHKRYNITILVSRRCRVHFLVISRNSLSRWRALWWHRINIQIKHDFKCGWWNELLTDPPPSINFLTLIWYYWYLSSNNFETPDGNDKIFWTYRTEVV